MPEALLFDTGAVYIAGVSPTGGRDARGTIPPSDDELGAAMESGARTALAKKFWGAPPQGMDHEDLVQAVCAGATKRCQKWRAGGPKDLQSFCYYACYSALMDILRRRAKDSEEYLDVLDSGRTLPLEESFPEER